MKNTLFRSLLAGTIGMGGLGSLPAGDVKAAFPGGNGKIVYSSSKSGSYEIYSSNSDGTNVVQLTTNAADEYDPAYSPDGRQVAFSRYVDVAEQIFVMNADGSNVRQLTSAGYNSNPIWSPDGTKILYSGPITGVASLGNDSSPQGGGGASARPFVMNVDGSDKTPLFTEGYYGTWSPSGSRILFMGYATSTADSELYTVNPDGTNLIQLTDNTISDSTPAWSPDGSKIAFFSTRDDASGEIYTMNSDGTGVLRLTNNLTYDSAAAWSHDGSKIVFLGDRDDANGEIYIMNPDGTGVVRLTTNTHSDNDPEWSPDGTKVLFTQYDSVAVTESAYTVNPDGTGLLNVSGTGGFLQGMAWQPLTTPFVYRFWSEEKKHHFYTLSIAERDHILATYPRTTWRLEGGAYKAKSTAECAGKSPVYRFWSNLYQGHFYTISAAEKQHVIDAYDDNTWKYEEESFCADTTAVTGTKPLYRFWSDKYRGHFFTASEAEKQHVIDTYDDTTWKYEGAAYHVE